MRSHGRLAGPLGLAFGMTGGAFLLLFAVERSRSPIVAVKPAKLSFGPQVRSRFFERSQSLQIVLSGVSAFCIRFTYSISYICQKHADQSSTLGNCKK